MGASGSTKNHRGAIVPMVTPLTPQGELDEPAVQRLVDFLCQGGVHGVFVLGTTGEGPFVPPIMRDRLVSLVTNSARDRLRVYANVSQDRVRDSIAAGNRYFKLGVDAVVAHAPARYERHPEQSVHYFTQLAHQLKGELIIYNMPLTTSVSLPLEVCRKIACQPRVVG